MSANDIQTVKVPQAENLEQVFNEMMLHAVRNALNNVSDEVMTNKEHNEEMDKATIIMKGAIAKIMNLDFYGDESIFQEDNSYVGGRLKCKDFFVTLMESCCEDVDQLAYVNYGGGR